MYDPATNTWTPLPSTGAPSGRVFHTAVLAGDAMIIWGGNDGTDQINAGGIYDITGDSWSATAAVPAPSATRERHTAVWTGTEMWTYGGFGDSAPEAITNAYFPTGAVAGGLRYDPGANVWSPAPTTSEPSARADHTAVFDGTHMIVFGGFDGTDELATGARINAGGIQWEPLGGTGPEPRHDHTAVWLADAGVMVIWGGNGESGRLGSGAIYTAASNQWVGPTPNALAPRDRHTAVSTGDRMIVWGGFDSSNNPLGDGGIYTP
jgi:hypothetical protein